jgi:superfamily I DNA/RNA helicase
LIAVGDPAQAIYGFTGADSDSLEQIKRAFNCIEMPLTVSFRCPKAVVSFARQWADHIVAADTAIEGVVETKTLEEILAEPVLLNSDAAVICRNTKPLIDLFFMLLRRKIPARIEGRDVGASLKKLATRWSSIKTINALEDKLADYLEKQRAKLLAKKQESRVQMLEDTVDAIIAICVQCRLEGLTRVDDVVQNIDAMFGDNVTGILTLTTIHKAKGREYCRVLWLDRAGTCPSPWAETIEAQQQESNLCYVAATRAKVQLIDVIVPPKRRQ